MIIWTHLSGFSESLGFPRFVQGFPRFVKKKVHGPPAKIHLVWFPYDSLGGWYRLRASEISGNIRMREAESSEKQNMCCVARWPDKEFWMGMNHSCPPTPSLTSV